MCTNRFRSFRLFSELLFVVNSFINCVEVSIEQGKLFGSTLKSSKNGYEFYAFYSIPYAKPPIGELRFQPPSEPEGWTGVRNYTEYPPACIQRDYFSKDMSAVFGQEDCLYLNVFTRKLKGDTPVLVYIHGGAYAAGGSFLYGPNHFMDQDVVLVTINYRLGVLGFLSSGDESLPGNNGMKDQVMSLRWIRKNIAAFGGDPGNVLIFGHSAGSASVHLHMFSPLSKGLFKKAFGLSGTALLKSWTLFPPYAMSEYFKTVSLLNGCSFRNAIDAVKCLKQVPAADLIASQMKLFVWNTDPVCTLGPTIEVGTVIDPFLTKLPQGGGELDPNVPWITGVTSSESIFHVQYYNVSSLKYLNDNYQRLLPVALIYIPTSSRLDVSSALADDVKRIYFQNREIGLETVSSLVEAMNDFYFIFGLIESVRNYKGRAYLYYYDYKSANRELSSDERFTSLGVSHGEELSFLFDGFTNRQEDANDRKLCSDLIKILTNFAYTGCPEITLMDNVEWIPAKEESLSYLHIGNDGFRLDTRYFQEKRTILDRFRKYFD